MYTPVVGASSLKTRLVMVSGTGVATATGDRTAAIRETMRMAEMRDMALNVSTVGRLSDARVKDGWCGSESLRWGRLDVRRMSLLYSSETRRKTPHTYQVS